MFISLLAYANEAEELIMVLNVAEVAGVGNFERVQTERTTYYYSIF